MQNTFDFQFEKIGFFFLTKQFYKHMPCEFIRAHCRGQQVSCEADFNSEVSYLVLETLYLKLIIIIFRLYNQCSSIHTAGNIIIKVSIKLLFAPIAQLISLLQLLP